MWRNSYWYVQLEQAWFPTPALLFSVSVTRYLQRGLSCHNILAWTVMNLRSERERKRAGKQARSGGEPSVQEHTHKSNSGDSTAIAGSSGKGFQWQATEGKQVLFQSNFSQEQALFIPRYRAHSARH